MATEVPSHTAGRAAEERKRLGVLRITTEAIGGQMNIKLEGRLAGPWVKELEKVWRSFPPSGKRLKVDMCSVTSVDAGGKELLGRMHSHGAELIADAPMTKYVIAEVTRGSGIHRKGEK